MPAMKCTAEQLSATGLLFFFFFQRREFTAEQRYWFIDADGLNASNVRARLTDFELDCPTC